MTCRTALAALLAAASACSSVDSVRAFGPDVDRKNPGRKWGVIVMPADRDSERHLDELLEASPEWKADEVFEGFFKRLSRTFGERVEVFQPDSRFVRKMPNAKGGVAFAPQPVGEAFDDEAARYLVRSKRWLDYLVTVTYSLADPELEPSDRDDSWVLDTDQRASLDVKVVDLLTGDVIANDEHSTVSSFRDEVEASGFGLLGPHRVLYEMVDTVLLGFLPGAAPPLNVLSSRDHNPYTARAATMLRKDAADALTKSFANHVRHAAIPAIEAARGRRPPLPLELRDRLRNADRVRDIYQRVEDKRALRDDFINEGLDTAVVDRSLLKDSDELRRLEELGRTLVDEPLERGLIQVAAEGVEKLAAEGVPASLLEAKRAMIPTFPGVPGLSWSFIPVANYTVGTPIDESGRGRDEIVPRLVPVTTAFLVSTTEVTQAVYRSVIPGAKWNTYVGPNLPAHSITFAQAIEFCEKLSERYPGFEFSLPTEPEWEIAARGGKQAKDQLPLTPKDPDAYAQVLQRRELDYVMRSYAYYRINSNRRPHPAGSKLANALGLHDVHGNVFEWCLRDKRVFKEDDTANFGKEPTRGGGYLSPYESCRSGARAWEYPNTAKPTIGFRIVCRSVSQ